MQKNKNLMQRPSQIKKVSDGEETVTSLIKPVKGLTVFDSETESFVPSTSKELKKSFYQSVEALPETFDTTSNLLYQLVFPDDLNLKPASGAQKSRGRPKKPKIQVESPPPPPPSVQKTKIKVVSKTRSGREVKFPKYIENEFKKIEINDDLPPNSVDVKISDFVQYADEDEKSKSEPQSKLMDQSEFLHRKRRITAQYRCPKCKKAYLGKKKILEHLKKNPSHGPMQQNEEKNFEVWNYLVNVTQKCPSSERGQKFCLELSNLLHNLLLLTNALFKKLGSASNEVKIDKVLANAIGLTPGNYYFDDNNLYKNVTVLKLMANNDFLHSIKSKGDDINLKSTSLSSSVNCNCGNRTGLDELFLKSMIISSETETSSKQVNHNKTAKSLFGENPKNNDEIGIVKYTSDKFFASSEVNSEPNFLSVNEYEIKSNLGDESHSMTVISSDENCKEQNSADEAKNVIHLNNGELTQVQDFCKKVDIAEENNVGHKTFTGDEFFSSDVNLVNNFSPSDYEMKLDNQTSLSVNINTDPIEHKEKVSSPKIKIQSNILICPPRFFQKNTTDSKSTDNQYVINKDTINPELMTDNSTDHNSIPLPNIRHSVDELMLPVTSEPSNILDNSSSSDEVMNVDQFVNERFRKITESDLEVNNGTSLNLELSSLDLFQFHTS